MSAFHYDLQKGNEIIVVPKWKCCFLLPCIFWSAVDCGVVLDSSLYGNLNKAFSTASAQLLLKGWALAAGILQAVPELCPQSLPALFCLQVLYQHCGSGWQREHLPRSEPGLWFCRYIEQDHSGCAVSEGWAGTVWGWRGWLVICETWDSPRAAEIGGLM